MTTSNVETPTYACALISIFDSRIKPDNFKKVSCIFQDTRIAIKIFSQRAVKKKKH